MEHRKQPLNYLPVPYSDLKLFDGNIVMFETYPCVKWITHCGVYTYEDKVYDGWYFVSIPEQKILPANLDDLLVVTRVADTINDKGCKPKPPKPCPPVPPTPPSPGPEIELFTKQDKEQLDAAFITVDSIEDRDALNKHPVPDGKIVRVNSEEKPEYYVWSQEDETWKEYYIENARIYWEII